MVLASVGAFSIIPNFLITGIAAITVGLLIVTWSIGFVHTRKGPLVFILLSILLFLVGGGFGQVPLFTLAWAVTTRISQPLTWWRKVLSAGPRRLLTTLWLGSFVASMLLFVVGVEIWLLDFVPGVTDATLKLHICWLFLIAGLAMLCLTIVSGFAKDIEAQDELGAKE